MGKWCVLFHTAVCAGALHAARKANVNLLCKRSGMEAHMEYMQFMEEVKSAFSQDGPWGLNFHCHVERWTSGDEEEETDYVNSEAIELMRFDGPFVHLISIAMEELYKYYLRNGWEATLYEIERHADHYNIPKEENKTILIEERLSEEGKELYARLRELRKQIAVQRKIPPYIVFNNRTLLEMSERMPESREELMKLFGVGEKNSALYGEQFLEAIREHRNVYNNAEHIANAL